MTATARRRLPDNCIIGHDINVVAMLRSSDLQWSSIERVASGAKTLLQLAAPNSDNEVAFRVELTDGQIQDGSVDQAGAVTRSPAQAPVESAS